MQELACWNDFPRTGCGVRAAVLDGGSLLRLPGGAAMARRRPLPMLRGRRSLAAGPWPPLGVQAVRPSGLGDRRHGLPRREKPLRLWFKAMFLMTCQHAGISARSLRKQLGLGSYQTAWTWMHRLRSDAGGTRPSP
jgi:hypothetical protein